MKGFWSFVRKQGAIGLAVGFLLGGAVSKLVSAFVEDIINPVLSIFLGAAEGLKDATLKIGDVVVIKWGDFLSSLIDFLIIAVVVYAFVRFLKIDEQELQEAKKKTIKGV